MDFLDEPTTGEVIQGQPIQGQPIQGQPAPTTTATTGVPAAAAPLQGAPVFRPPQQQHAHLATPPRGASTPGHGATSPTPSRTPSFNNHPEQQQQQLMSRMHDEVARMREDRKRLVDVNEQLVTRLQNMALELQKYIDKDHPNAAHILNGTPGYTSPPNATGEGGNVKSKFSKFFDEVTEKRDLKEEVEVLRGRLMKLQDNESEVHALQIGLEVCQADYSSAVRSQHEAEKTAKRCEEESRILRESLNAYEGDAQQAQEEQEKVTQDAEDLDELFGAELAAKVRAPDGQTEEVMAGTSTAAAAVTTHHSHDSSPSGKAVGAMVSELREKVLQLQGSVETQDEKVAAERDEVTRLNKSLHTLNSDLRDVHKQKGDIEDQRDHFQAANEKLEAQLKRLLGVVNTAQEHESEAYALHKKIEFLGNEVRRLEGELEAERSCATETASTSIVFRKEIANLKNQLDEKDRTLSTTLISLETYEDQEQQIENTKTRVNKLNAELKSTRRELEERTEMLLERNRTLRNTSSMLKSTVPRLTREVSTLQLSNLAKSEGLSRLHSKFTATAAALEEAESKLQTSEAVAARLADVSDQHSGEADDAVRQVTLDLKKANELNKELKKQLLRFERQVEDQKAAHAVALDVEHQRTHSALSEGIGGGGGGSANTTPVSSQASFRRHADPAPPVSPGAPTTSPSFANGGHAVDDSSSLSGLLGRINQLEAANKVLQDECDKKGDIITSIVSKHPEVLAGPYAPSMAQQKQTKAAHPFGFGKGLSGKSKAASCTAQEFANLQSVLEQTMVENMRLTKDADVLGAECGRLSDLLAKAAASTKEVS